MTFRRRLSTAVLLVIPALAIYGLGRYYSPDVIEFVVAQSLVEKAPAGTDSEAIKSRFRKLMANSATRGTRMETLLELSQYLEKVQELSGAELELLLQGTPPGSFRP